MQGIYSGYTLIVFLFYFLDCIDVTGYWKVIDDGYIMQLRQKGCAGQWVEGKQNFMVIDHAFTIDGSAGTVKDGGRFIDVPDLGMGLYLQKADSKTNFFISKFKYYWTSFSTYR